jgi:hypothetical protein
MIENDGKFADHCHVLLVQAVIGVSSPSIFKNR